MTIRVAFGLALIMLIAGILGSHRIYAALFGTGPQFSMPEIAAAVPTHTGVRSAVPVSTRHVAPTPSPTRLQPTARPTKIPATTIPTKVPATIPIPTPTVLLLLPSSTPRPQSTVRPVRPHRLRHRTHTTRRQTAHRKVHTTVNPTPLPTPTATQASGIVTLTNYWVGSMQAQRGQTVSIGYVINNGTGRLTHVLLGATIKPIHVLSWAGATVSDPSHDVVAVVPPGTTTHVRFFTLPSVVRPGVYDVAWGLRDAVTGERDALVTAASVLRIHS